MTILVYRYNIDMSGHDTYLFLGTRFIELKQNMKTKKKQYIQGQSIILLSLRINPYFRSHFEYTRSDGDGSFFKDLSVNCNPPSYRLYSIYAQKKRNQSLYVHFTACIDIS